MFKLALHHMAAICTTLKAFMARVSSVALAKKCSGSKNLLALNTTVPGRTVYCTDTS